MEGKVGGEGGSRGEGSGWEGGTVRRGIQMYKCANSGRKIRD